MVIQVNRTRLLKWKPMSGRSGVYRNFKWRIVDITSIYIMEVTNLKTGKIWPVHVYECDEQTYRTRINLVIDEIIERRL